MNYTYIAFNEIVLQPAQEGHTRSRPLSCSRLTEEGSQKLAPGSSSKYNDCLLFSWPVSSYKSNDDRTEFFVMSF